MPLTVANPASADDVNVFGFRAYFRNKTTLTAGVTTSDTVPVENAKWFQAGDVCYIGDVGAFEEVTILSVSGNTITLSAPTTGTFASGAAFRHKDFWHMGHVRNPDRTQDRTVREVQSAIDGKLATIKEIVTSVTKGISFDSISGVDTYVQALHKGNPSYAGVVADTTVFVDDVNAVSGELLIVQANAETGGVAIVEYHPSVSLSGDGEADGADGENETALTFAVSINSESGYTIPAALSTDAPAAPLGVIVKAASTSVDAVTTVFADGTA